MPSESVTCTEYGVETQSFYSPRPATKTSTGPKRLLCENPAWPPPNEHWYQLLLVILQSYMLRPSRFPYINSLTCSNPRLSGFNLPACDNACDRICMRSHALSPTSSPRRPRRGRSRSSQENATSPSEETEPSQQVRRAPAPNVGAALVNRVPKEDLLIPVE